MGDIYPKIRVAAVQAAPVFLNREASVEKACRLIREAGAGGARLIAFPESFIPAHPVWYYFHTVFSSRALSLATELFKNSVEIPSPATDALCQAARDASAYVVIGVCEKLPGSNGTMYNTHIFIDRSGRLLGKRQKLVPTVSERLVHTPGYDASARAVETEFGPISALLCGENSNPLAIFAYTAQASRIHISAWPHFFAPGWNKMTDATLMIGQGLAYMSKMFVINACGTVDAAMIEALAVNDEERAFVTDPTQSGGSTIINPAGKVIAGPMGPEEGILYADVDLEDTVRAKLVHDFAGHYNRADVFQVNMSMASTRLYNPVDSPLPAVGAPEDAEPSVLMPPASPAAPALGAGRTSAGSEDGPARLRGKE